MIITNKGYSLMEILVCLGLICVIIMAFTPLFIRMTQIILEAGDLGISLFEKSGEVERRRAESLALKGGTISIEFGEDLSIDVEGGFIEVDHLYTFISNIPIMCMNPYEFNEGFLVPKIIDILGNNTNFTSDSSVYITNKEGLYIPSSLYFHSLVNCSSETEAGIRITGQLSNALSPYIVTVKTDLDIGIEECVRAQLIIHLPGAMIVGKDSIYISDGDLNHWSKRNSFSDFTSVSFGNNSYLIVGKDGTIKRLAYGGEWEDISSPTPHHLHKVIRTKFQGEGQAYFVFIAIGDEGAILHSPQGLNWNKLDQVPAQLPSGIKVEDISFKHILIEEIEDSEMILLVGQRPRDDDTSTEGIIVVINRDQEELFEQWEPSFPPLRGVAWGDDEGDIKHFIAVGEEGYIVKSQDGENWNDLPLTIDSPTLNDITWVNDKFIIVGEEGNVLSLTYDTDEEEWNLKSIVEEEMLQGDLEDYRFNSVIYSIDRLVVVGCKIDDTNIPASITGIILFSSDEGENWNELELGESELFELVFR